VSRHQRAIRAIAVPLDAQTIVNDLQTGETFHDRSSTIDGLREQFPNHQIVRWQGSSVIEDATQTGALLILSADASADEVIEQAGQIFTEARQAQFRAAAALYTAIEHAHRSGISELQISKLAGVDRMTVRRALGKR